MMNEEIINLTAEDGHKLFIRKWTSRNTKSQPRGVMHINHGMAEHSARYADIAEKFTDKGYVVYAHDHRGHGYSVQPGELLGHYADKNGWDKVIGDIYLIHEHIRQQYPATPILLMGHSMGSFIVQSYAVKYGDTLSALILSGSAFHTQFTVNYAEMAIRIEKARSGPYGRSKLLDFLTFGTYNQNFAPVRSRADWLSRDPRQVDAYVNDPLCGFLCTNQMWLDMLKGIRGISKLKNLRRIPNKLPILMFSGEMDPMSYDPKEHGIKKLADRYKAAGQHTVTYKIFPKGRHEILNEVNRWEVVDFWLNWQEHQVPMPRQLPSTKPELTEQAVA